MKVLVLSPESVDPERLREVLGEQADEAEVRVVVSAANESPLAFWVSDSDEAIADAQDSQRKSVADLRDDGVDASGDTGEPEPLLALEDALATFDADRVIVFVRAEEERNYREDEKLGQAEERLGRPVSIERL